jgi:ABC-type branched-subunit amino acid transport system ATPase component
MSLAILELQGVSKSFDSLRVLQNISLTVETGSIVGLIGPNGSGKSTLFDIVSGFQSGDSGTVIFRGRRLDGRPPHVVARAGLMRTFQLSEGGQRLTAIENLLAAAQDQIEANLVASVLDLRGLLWRERVNIERARDILTLLGLRQVANEYVGTLSGGQRKLVDLGRIFMAKPRLCLLDEPTAGVNPTMTNVILDALKAMRRAEEITLLIVEHNMQVISEICEKVYVLDAGILIAEGSPDAIQADDRVLSTYLGRSRAAEIA